MDELDFLESLSRLPADEAQDMLHKLKTAAARDSVKKTLKEVAEWAKEHASKSKAWARENKEVLIGGAVGGTAGTAGTYHGHKKDPKTGLSPSQKLSRTVAKKAGKPSKKDSYAKGVTKTVARASKEYDDVASKHPRAAAVTEGLALGVPAGAAAAKFMFKRKK